jgi:hypothetical protein
MKFCVLIMFQALPWISRIGDWALRWTEGNERLQVAFVMLLFPLVMNGVQYYIIDTFIKDTHQEGMMQVPTEDPDDDDSLNREAGVYEDSRDSRSREGSDIGPDEDVKRSLQARPIEQKTKKAISISEEKKQLKLTPGSLTEYDPIRDGEGSPTDPGEGSSSAPGSAK